MRFNQVLERALALAGEGRPALLSTLGLDGRPRSRWMVPIALPRLKGRLFALSSMSFDKIAEIENDGRVQWILQSDDLSLVATLEGRAFVFRDPSFSAELVKAIGPGLERFWSLEADPSSLAAIETEILTASIFLPRTGETYRASAREGEEASHE